MTRTPCGECAEQAKQNDRYEKALREILYVAWAMGGMPWAIVRAEHVAHAALSSAKGGSDGVG